MKYPIHNPLGYLLLYVIDLLSKVAFSPFLKKNITSSYPKKILICNGGHLGDVILTTSLLPLVKKIYPEARIGMLIARWASPIIEKHPLIEWTHYIDHWKLNRQKKPFIKKIQQYFSTRQKALREIRPIAYDIAIDCRFHFPNMAFFLWQAKIHERLGFSSAGLGAFLTHAHSWNPHQHAVYSFQELLPALSPPYKPLFASLSISPSKKKRNPYIALQIGSGDHSRWWPLKNWKALAHLLAKENLPLHFLGKGNEENTIIEEVIENLPQARNLCNHLNWQQWVASIQEATLFIGIESAGGHIAAAVKTPSVLLFTRSNFPIWRPLNPHAHILTPPFPEHRKKNEGIQTISVETVYAAVKNALKHQPSLQV